MSNTETESAVGRAFDGSAATPIRVGLKRTERGLLMATSGRIDYEDGAEGRVLEILQNANDVSSGNNALVGQETEFAVRYHLHSSRANVMRALDIPAAARVVEIGAGCGAVTRYLGENCALVDAIEPVSARANVARERCRDLDSVEVIVGGVDDLPGIPTYDLAVVIGVLEYVGDGAPDEAPYIEFLRRLRSALMPGGTLVLAIENRLGVKYLSGTPEDHSGRLFHGVEGYVTAGPARTFDRDHLIEMANAAGYHSTSLGVFPDYKFTRAVLADRVFESDLRQLAWNLPRFPSPINGTDAPRIASERHLWRSLVDAGVGATFSNSFLLIGRTGPASVPELWPAAVAARFLSESRAGVFSTRSEVHVGAAEPVVSRHRLHVGDARIGTVDHHFSPSSPLLDGVLLAEAISADPSRASQLIVAWECLLGARETAGDTALTDLIPRNVLVDQAGSLHAIDLEWNDSAMPLWSVLGRGLLHLAVDLYELLPPGSVAEATIGDLAAVLASATSFGGGGRWISSTLRHEARFAATVAGRPVGDVGHGAISMARLQEWQELLAQPLNSGRLGSRDVNGVSPAQAAAPVLHAVRPTWPIVAGPAFEGTVEFDDPEPILGELLAVAIELVAELDLPANALVDAPIGDAWWTRHAGCPVARVGEGERGGFAGSEAGGHSRFLPVVASLGVVDVQDGELHRFDPIATRVHGPIVVTAPARAESDMRERAKKIGLHVAAEQRTTDGWVALALPSPLV